MKFIKEKLRWGILGCGDVCEVKSGPAFNKVANSELVAVMRRDKEKAADYARRHHVPRFYTDAESLVNDKEVNAIYIATPPSLHEPYTELALKSDKPVYVEKPVTLNAASCERMIHASKKYDNRVSVAHYRRGLPIFKKVKSLILEGAIGNVMFIELKTLQPSDSKLITHTKDNWRVQPDISGGGLFHDLSPHQLDILYWIFGEPTSVTGHSWNLSKTSAAPDLTILNAVYNNPYKGREGDVCLNGVWGFSFEEQSAAEHCMVYGDRGNMRFSFFKKSTIELVTTDGIETLEFDYPENIQQPMIDAVTRFFRGEGPNPCSLEEAMVTMKMMDSTR
ncbi:MAG TPA: Gfo/Idh/MocA family oxidoreductase [Cyclobacteriaceae bacterium]|nr:Gfo/Idh/MocA family oxidoreductase [Cyclobacteriaceae bacterium]